MRTLAAFAIVIAASSFTGSAHAERYWPWCARYNGWTVVCGFASFQQCLTTISGVGGFCEQNVMPPPSAESRASGKRKVRRTY